MTEESEFKKGIDIGRVVESTLLGGLLLIGRYLKTVYLFVVRPTFFSGILNEGDRESSSKSNDVARPLTFMLISFVVLISVFVAIFKFNPSFDSNLKFSVTENNIFITFLIDGLKSFDIKKLFISISPFFLAVGLYSYMISSAAIKRNYIFKFDKSIGLSSFFCGAAVHVWIISALLMPLMDLDRSINANGYLPSWGYVTSIVLWGLLFRIIYAYFVILKLELQITIKETIVIWWGGTWRFFISYFLILSLTIPFTLMGDFKQDHSPKSQITNPNQKGQSN